jgi:outer membrane receptor protein involved in Fe transport
VTFRGYSASPLGGAPQGISVFLDGVRMNEPFGDTVRWDLIPSFAIQGMQMVPGSNPVYGLNTLGGAIAIQTKSGRTNQGAALEASAGSWARKNVSAEYGGVSKDGSVDYFLGVNYLDENGWRKFSPTTVKQTFGKVGWQSESTKIDLSYLNINNDMIGNGLVPQELMAGLGRETIHTRPDQTRNSLNQITLNASHWLNNDVMLSANSYYRRSNQKTLNGDVSDEYDPLVRAADECDNDEDACRAVNNFTRTRTNAVGLSGQLAFNQNFLNKKNQLIVGLGIDRSMSKFGQSEQAVSDWDSTRAPSGETNDLETTTNFKGKTTTSHIFATDTLSINELVHINAGLRYNYSKVDNKDFLVGTAGHLGDAGGRHSFSRVNPTVGLTLTPNQNVSIYGSYSESNRAPTAMELACADPATPCLLPNAMASDPPLKQVVAKTYDLGAKGNLGANLKWNASVYHAMNHNDLQFIHSGTSGNSSLGYFDNVGKTKRQGLDLGLSANIDKLTLTGSYGYVRATYDDSFTLTSESNSSGVPDPTDVTRVIEVNKGNYLAGIPKHQFKLRAQYEVIPAWTVGANLVAFSSRYMHGNENNKHQANAATCDVDTGDGDEIPCGKGKTSGYAIVNLDTQYNVGSGWKVFAKAINVFDKDYETTGRLGMSHFGSAGNWSDDTLGTRLLSPGAPRAGWIGVRYEFGGAPEAK